MTEAGSLIASERLALYTWAPTAPEVGVCVLFHGYGAHARYPTVRYAATAMAACGLRCYCADLPGHGASEGTPGLMLGAEICASDGAAIANHVRSLHPDARMFLAGTSMGGAVALGVSKRVVVDGVVLLAPMVKTLQQPAAPVVLLLRGLSWVLPWLAVIPTSASDDSIQYTDEERRAECAADTGSTYHGMMRLSTAVTLLDIASELHASLQEIEAPFWVGIGGREVVVDPQGVEDLWTVSSTVEADKELKRYPTAQHGLLAEPKPLRDEIEADMHVWVRGRLAMPRRKGAGSASEP